jgi:hypothetical protein
MQEKRRGIPGITRPLDESDESWLDYTPKEKKDHGLNQLLQVPKEIVGAGFKATLGALSLLIARNLGISDPIKKAEAEIADLEEKIEKKSGNKSKLQEKLASKKEFLANINQGVELSQEILKIRNEYQEYLNNDDYLFSLLAETIGNPGLVEIENNLLVNQASSAQVKAITAEEISLSQRIAAPVTSEEDQSDLLKNHIKSLEKENLLDLAKQLLNLNKIEKIKQTMEKTDFNINLVSWSEALLAAVLGATGRTKSSIRGGYKVRVEEGDVVVYVGGDRDHVAPLEKITVDFDVPEIYEAALAVANQEVPLFKSKVIANLIKKAMGTMDDNWLLPGRIDIGQTGSSDRVSYPALNINRQVEHLEIARAAALEMDKILKEINGNLHLSGDGEDQKAQLIAAGIEGALAIPRYNVVLELMKQINPAEAEGLSSKFRFTEREKLPNDDGAAEEKELSEEEMAIQQKQEDLKKAGFREKISPQIAKAIVNNIDTYQVQLVDRFAKKEGKRLSDLILNEALDILGVDLETIQLKNDLEKAGFVDGIDQRTATLIIEHPEAYLAHYTKQFGEKEAQRLMEVIEKEALFIVDVDLKQIEDMHDLSLAGYSAEMTKEEAKDFLLKIQKYRERLIKMYGEQQGNRIASNIRSIAKRIIEKDE